MDWLEILEERVQEAAERIRHLRDDNTRLENRVKELEGELDSVRAEGNPDWEDEKKQIRERVEGLAESLANLLEEDD